MNFNKNKNIHKIACFLALLIFSTAACALNIYSFCHSSIYNRQPLSLCSVFDKARISSKVNDVQTDSSESDTNFLHEELQNDTNGSTNDNEQLDNQNNNAENTPPTDNEQLDNQDNNADTSTIKNNPDDQLSKKQIKKEKSKHKMELLKHKNKKKSKFNEEHYLGEIITPHQIIQPVTSADKRLESNKTDTTSNNQKNDITETKPICTGKICEKSDSEIDLQKKDKEIAATSSSHAAVTLQTNGINIEKNIDVGIPTIVIESDASASIVGNIPTQRINATTNTNTNISNQMNITQPATSANIINTKINNIQQTLPIKLP